ncbi:MAG: hypothetical protein H3C43_01200, partial [Leptonema sp. (in: Bacteria)]|nr:hypothetical protein [Leptonema sp. (in: bacteria)]
VAGISRVTLGKIERGEFGHTTVRVLDMILDKLGFCMSRYFIVFVSLLSSCTVTNAVITNSPKKAIEDKIEQLPEPMIVVLTVYSRLCTNQTSSAQCSSYTNWGWYPIDLTVSNKQSLFGITDTSKLKQINMLYQYFVNNYSIDEEENLLYFKINSLSDYDQLKNQRSFLEYRIQDFDENYDSMSFCLSTYLFGLLPILSTANYRLEVLQHQPAIEPKKVKFREVQKTQVTSLISLMLVPMANRNEDDFMRYTIFTPAINARFESPKVKSP